MLNRTLNQRLDKGGHLILTIAILLVAEVLVNGHFDAKIKVVSNHF
jgi:hypothetical protein